MLELSTLPKKVILNSVILIRFLCVSNLWEFYYRIISRKTLGFFGGKRRLGAEWARTNAHQRASGLAQ